MNTESGISTEAGRAIEELRLLGFRIQDFGGQWRLVRQYGSSHHASGITQDYWTGHNAACLRGLDTAKSILKDEADRRAFTNPTSSGFRADNLIASLDVIAASVIAFATAVVLPIPDGPSITIPRPGVFRATSSRVYSFGGTKVYSGIPETVKTSCSSGLSAIASEKWLRGETSPFRIVPR
jgi:hypothetical protein